MEQQNPGQSSSTETNKKKNNYRRRNNNKKKTDKPEKKTEKPESSKKPEETKALKGFKKVGRFTKDDEQDDDYDGEVCFICTRPIDYYAVAPCNHRTCHMCTLRLRVLYKTNNCAYCKAEAKRVVFTNDAEKPYDDYKRDDTPFYEKKYGIRFETKDMYNDTLMILQYNCPEKECEEAFESWNELKRHVKQVHHLVCCDLCLRNKKIFSHEHTLYTQAQLQKHYREGDTSFNKEDETGFTGHPECVFCKTRFYGADELFEHCRSKHEQCHLCVRNGIQHQYYANYDSLEKHFNKEHFLCQYKECLDNKFVVFDSEIDLKAHELQEHGNTLSRQQRAKQSRVDVNVNYAGSPSSSSRKPKTNTTVNLSAEDFPDINGSVNPTALLSSQLASTRVSEQEQWPTLGEEKASSSPSSSSRTESETAIVSRHAAALDRIADLFKNVEKMIKFRQLTNGYINANTPVTVYVDSVFDLCGKDAKFTAQVLSGAKEIIDDQVLRSNMIRTWNEKSPASIKDDEAPRVLVVNPGKQNRQPKRAGVWDKVANAAMDAGAYRTAFPTIQSSGRSSKTPWSGTSSRTNSDSNLQDLFPALPTANNLSRRAEINSMLKKPSVNAWGESSTPNESDYSDSTDTSNRKKKGKKGKQVLFRVGL